MNKKIQRTRCFASHWPRVPGPAGRWRQRRHRRLPRDSGPGCGPGCGQPARSPRRPPSCLSGKPAKACDTCNSRTWILRARRKRRLQKIHTRWLELVTLIAWRHPIVFCAQHKAVQNNGGNKANQCCLWRRTLMQVAQFIHSAIWYFAKDAVYFERGKFEH